MQQIIEKYENNKNKNVLETNNSNTDFSHDNRNVLMKEKSFELNVSYMKTCTANVLNIHEKDIEETIKLDSVDSKTYFNLKGSDNEINSIISAFTENNF